MMFAMAIHVNIRTLEDKLILLTKRIKQKKIRFYVMILKFTLGTNSFVAKDEHRNKNLISVLVMKR